jgi:TM2 domain-containing membrane protein YozV
MSGATCPYCRTAFETDDEIVTCSGCATRHHADCLEENGGCTVFGCSQAPAEEPMISVSDRDLASGGRQETATSAPPPSFLNLSSPAPSPAPSPAAVTPPPPPPRPAGAPPPPPPPAAGTLHTSYPAVMTYPTFGGYAPRPPAPINSYEPRKSRVVFVLLAVLLGAFGGHNFYAGYVKKAVIQLCITLFSCFIGSFVSWIWAIVEACMVDRDDDGVAFV